ncbi:transcription factor TGA2.3-like [Andrographis paniculata]|uniref:transcription factor TGA2.3-like n=1 Tax=Andrographis paniculata TaxID=175694 RepID=UPI0021E833B2|nr:transcription factor TGA2.3-like [Andrographis paniculata]XP_051146337.1 transcription factor TGA2.3-like [Andrographis paniculata]XP_051146338.1 transcription factor TGA2.3-like [Andrographis paniculata]
MHSFKPSSVPQAITLTNSNLYCTSQSPFYLRGEENGRNGTRFADLGELEQSAGHGFHHDDAVNLSRTSIYNELKASNVSVVSSNLQFGGLNNSLGSTEMVSSGTGVDSSGGQFMLQKGGAMVGVGRAEGGEGALGNGHFENWGDSGVVADHSQQTDTSTDTDEKNQYIGVNDERLLEQCKGKVGDQKALRRLAQNREAARKSRMRKKAYVQQLENSRLRLTQLEQELKVARQQGILARSGLSADQSHSMGRNGAVAFDIDYARWLDEHQRLIGDLRSAVNSQVGDNELRLLVDEVMSHYDEIFRLKSIGAKLDVFHILSGMWKTPAERCFMWLGGFRCSEVLKILGNQIEPLTEQQLMGICNLQQSSQQFEDALSQGMEVLQQSLVDSLSSNSLLPHNVGNVAVYMGQMATAMSKLASLENFIHQADTLRRQILQQLPKILTTRQAARALLAISDYKSRLRALSSLWLARPKE